MNNSVCYEKMYFLLFNKVSDALSALGNYNYGEAADILRFAQQETEKIYLEEGEKET